jgi:hypothetical protein
MHLIWTNLIPNLILFWTGEFKDISHHDEGYVLAPTVWEAIGEATVNAGKTIPAAFGSRVPNIGSEKAQMIAETHSIWTLYIAPTLLKGHFVHPQYYKHFMELVRLLMLCLEFEITQDQVNDLERGFQSWVQEYEQYVLLVASGILSDKLTGYTTNIIHCTWLVVPSTHCCTLHQLSGLWVQSGLIGLFRWSAIVETSSAMSQAGGFPIQTSISMLPPVHS